MFGIQDHPRRAARAHLSRRIPLECLHAASGDAARFAESLRADLRQVRLYDGRRAVYDRQLLQAQERPPERCGRAGDQTARNRGGASRPRGVDSGYDRQRRAPHVPPHALRRLARPRHAAARHGAAPFRLRQHPSGRLYDRVRLSDRFARREYAAACQRLVRAGRRPSGQCVADLSDTPPCGGVPPRDEGRHLDAAAGARSLRDPQSETQATAHDRPQSAGGLYPRCRRGGRQPLPASVEHQDFRR